MTIYYTWIINRKNPWNWHSPEEGCPAGGNTKRGPAWGAANSSPFVCPPLSLLFSCTQQCFHSCLENLCWLRYILRHQQRPRLEKCFTLDYLLLRVVVTHSCLGRSAVSPVNFHRGTKGKYTKESRFTLPSTLSGFLALFSPIKPTYKFPPWSWGENCILMF